MILIYILVLSHAKIMSYCLSLTPLRCKDQQPCGAESVSISIKIFPTNGSKNNILIRINMHS